MWAPLTHIPDAKDSYFSDIYLESGRGTPFTISQCTTLKGGGGPRKLHLLEV